MCTCALNRVVLVLKVKESSSGFDCAMSVAHLPLTEENDMSFSMEDDDEEEVHVKSKPLLDDALSDDPPLALDDHIEHPPNGGPPNLTSKAPMLEIADRQSRGDSSSLTPLVWTQGEFGLSGHFKIQGKRCTLRLEDDILRWSPDTRKSKQSTIHEGN